MTDLIQTDAFEQTASTLIASRVPRLAASAELESRPDAHRIFSSQEGAAAECSLWWRNTPVLDGHRVGLIGQYSANSTGTGAELLNQACGELAAHGCTLAVGPMDGSTWRKYRLVTETNSEPPFFLEPDNPPDLAQHFTRAGFNPLATYCSSVVEALDYEAPKARRSEERLKKLGIQLRALETSEWETNLRDAYRISIASFQRAFLYQPITEIQFLELYNQIRKFVRPELVFFAIHNGRAVGFVCSLPDLLEARRGRPVETVILKTLAILPGREYAGLGWYLTQYTHRVACRLGYRRVIHALMREGNVSLNISRQYGTVFRRYAIFSRPL